MEATLRNIDYHTTETLLLTSCFLLITIAKITHETRFASFAALLFSDKYLKIYGKDKQLNLSWFTILLFLCQVIIFGLLIKVASNTLGNKLETHVTVVILLLSLFVLFKFYLEKFLAEILELEKFSEHFNFHKVSYRNYIAIVLLPFVAMMIYSPFEKKPIIYITLGLFLVLNVIAYIITLRNHQKLILPRLFYFILYLCALEIAPYLLIYKWVY
ncbi:DUF4271 domain-containing protein [Flavobacteriaceae bacterium M23B6Z8]